jgi:hypothetical protein
MTYQTQSPESLKYTFAEFGKVAQLIKEQRVWQRFQRERDIC